MTLTPGQKAARTRVLRRMELERKAALADKTIAMTLEIVRNLGDSTAVDTSRLSAALVAIAEEWGPIERFCDRTSGDDLGDRDRTAVHQIVNDLRAEEPEIETEDLLFQLYEEARKETIEAVRQHLSPAMDSADAEHSSACGALEDLEYTADYDDDYDELERDLIVAQMPPRRVTQ